MTTRLASLRKRLETLETAAAARYGPGSRAPATKLLAVLIAHFLGCAGPREAIAEAMSRGLNYDNPRLLKLAMVAGSGSAAGEDLKARWSRALVQLFALKGATPDCDAQTFAAVLEALYCELSGHLQQHPMLMACGIVNAAT